MGKTRPILNESKTNDMKKANLLLAVGLLFASQGNSQIINATNPEVSVAGVVVNTGLAIAPDFHWQALVYDDPSFTNYQIDWRDNTGALLYSNSQPGFNPDVAYYSNPDALVVAYENGGQIFVDDYYYTGGSPLYFLNANNNVASGTNPNVDINSPGYGVLTWEDGGMVFACTFNIGTFMAGPPVAIAPGSNPDIIVLDNNDEVIITYEQGGNLIVESYNHWQLMAGIPTLMASHTFPIYGAGWELPRVASQRNSMFGPADDFTVVAQANLGGGQYLVVGLFFNGSATFTAQKVNVGVINCPTFGPKPVVAYERKFVNIAWAQSYDPGCATIPVGPGPWLDVLMGEFDNVGNNINGPSTYLEVNQLNLDFSMSSTSLSTEYDGNYLINNTNYCEGIMFNDPGDAFWKKRDIAVPTFLPVNDVINDPIAVVKAPESNEIKVVVEGMDESTTETATFTLVDNTGREVAISNAVQQGDTYVIDAGALTEGIYLLNCTIGNRTKTARIPHFKQ